jgi:Trk K+ transport system NAD-binding subunit
VLAIDFDPQALQEQDEAGLRVLFGDAEDPELPALLPLEDAALVISTTRDLDVNLALVHALRRHGYAGRIAAAAHDDEEASLLRRAGVDEVLIPFADAGESAARLLTR